MSASTRVAVERTAQQLGYRRKSDAPSGIRTVGLFFNEALLHPPDTLFFGPLIQHLQRALARHAFSLSVFGVTDSEDITGEIPSWSPDSVKGAIVLSRFTSKFVRALQSRVPVIWVDHYDASVDCDKVVTENQLGGFVAVQHLIDRGHQSIGFLGNRAYSPSYEERWQGYTLALSQAGILHPSTWECTEIAKDDTDGILDCLDALDAGPSAWFCVNDLLALTLIQILGSRGVIVPDDVAVVGFDDLQLAQTATPSVTTMHIDPTYYAERTVTCLTRRLTHPECPTELIRIVPTLTVRSSSAANLVVDQADPLPRPEVPGTTL